MSENGKPPMFHDRMRRDLYDQRVLVLDGPLDDDNGTLLTTQLISLAATDPSADIALWIHSPGGSVPSMLAIRDVMRVIPCDVSTLALGIAYSAGQFLLSAARGASAARCRTPASSCTRVPPESPGPPSTSSCRRTTCATPATRSWA